MSKFYLICPKCKKRTPEIVKRFCDYCADSFDNLKVLRYHELVRILNKTGNMAYGAEIGCNRGETTRYLLDNLTGLKHLTCVDNWAVYDGNDYFKKTEKAVEAKKQFLHVTHAFQERMLVIHKPSVDAAKFIKKGSLDFVFIDANHQYKYVKEDIIAWAPKVKTGGVICGDDYATYKYCKGVKKAVDEIYPAAKIEDAMFWWTIK